MMLSAPEKDGKIIEIDNDIIKSSYKNYLYENKQSDVKIYFPKNLKDEFEIRYGEKSVKIKLHEDLKNCSDGCVVSHKNSFGNTVRAVKYKNSDIECYFFPTSGSLECELYSNDINNLKEIKFLTSGINYTRKIKSGDIVIMNESEQISNIIRKPLYKYKFEFVYGNNVEVLNLASGSRLIFGTDTELKKEEGTVNLSFEIDRDKMFDSYFEKYNQMPTYIDNICFLKNDTEYYCQNNLEKFIDLKNADIISADFNIYNFLNSGEADVFDIKESWSTVLVSKIQPENCSYIKTVGLKSQKYSSVDITNELKNKENDFCGLKFVSKSGEAYLATSDNYHNPFYYRITFNGDIKNRYTL